MAQVRSTDKQCRYTVNAHLHCTGFVSGGIIGLEYTQCILIAHNYSYIQATVKVQCHAVVLLCTV